MLITLSPMRRDDSLTLHRAGDVLTINGTGIDLAAYDAEAAPCDWILGQPVLEGGQWQVALILPHGPIPRPAPPEAAAVTDPAPLVLTGDGPVALPFYAGPGG